MASKAKAKPSERLTRAKKERGAVVAARLKQIANSKRKGSRSRGYSLRSPGSPARWLIVVTSGSAKGPARL